MSAETKRVAVIGAGWAGLATAVELVASGHHVDVFEASRTLGGRARTVTIDGRQVDNGQHILIGAYTETLRLMRMVGADPDKLLKRIPLSLEFPGNFLLKAPRLPAPLHLLYALVTAQGLDWKNKWAAIQLMQSLKRTNFRIEPDISVSTWLDRNQTPSRQRRLLWEPLCVAALNTPVDYASAQVLATVLRDSLASDRAASDFLLPQVDLSSLFPEPATLFIEKHGGKVNRQCRVRELRRLGNAWHVDGRGPYNHVVLAVAPFHVAALIPELAANISHFTWEPIITTYLCYPEDIRLPQAMLGVADGYAQWLFDRGQLCGQNGLIAAVISAHGRHQEISVDELERRIQAEVGKIIPDLPVPNSVQTITEKRATFACTTNLQRPSQTTALPGLSLAGDYVAGDYPATLEGAIRSGIAVAARIGKSNANSSLLPN